MAQIGARPFPARSLLVLAIIALLAALQVIKAPERRLGRGARPDATHATLVGRARVIDGDTMDIGDARIRLEGIDAPEMEQSCATAAGTRWPCGRAATQALRAYVAGRELTCLTGSLDRYRRLLATCALPDGTDVNAWLVQQGWALAYGYGGIYNAEEAEAQAAKRGIWSGTFLPPWEWRRRNM